MRPQEDEEDKPVMILVTGNVGGQPKNHQESTGESAEVPCGPSPKLPHHAPTWTRHSAKIGAK